MYRNDNSVNECCESKMPMKETIPTITGEVMKLASRCEGLSKSIEGNLIGSKPSNEKNGSNNIYCLLDLLKEIRYILGNAVDVLETVNKKL